MSGKGVAGSDGRVSIPNSVKDTINNIKEVAGQNHSDDEIYAMLKECSMDPNETTQKLLLLDTFHEVKRKKDRRKENLNEAAESKWKPGIQARPNRAGRGNYPSRYISHSSGRNSVAAKENVTSPLQYKGTKTTPLASAQEIKKEGPSFMASSIAALPNGSSSMTSHCSNIIHDNHADPVLLPSQDSPLHSAVGPIHCEVGSDRAPVRLIADSPIENKLPSVKNSAFEVESSNSPLTLANNFHGAGKNQHLDPPLSESITSGASIVSSRPSSNHNNRSQVIGPHKVGTVKEWKPKAANSIVGDGVSTVTSSESVKSHPESQDILELQRKSEESHILNSEHVIIPNHLHVPQAEKLGFCFGSFDVASVGELSHNGVPGSEKGHLLSQSSETETSNEPVEEQQLSHRNALSPAEDTETNYPGQSQIQSPIQEPEFFSSNEVEISSSVTPGYDESKQEFTPGTIQQHPIVHTSSNYNYGLMPPTLNGQLTPLESSESQARDAPRFPGYIVPQSYDPASYYAQIYRSGMDTDGRTSPFISAGAAANKYSGNAAVVSQQPTQSLQEGGVPLVLSTSAPTEQPTQQPLPIFRQPTGVHLPHFPPNYIPYGPYLSPYYIPPPTIHQFLSNGAFPQQPQASNVNVYPTLSGTNAAKYPVSQYKQGSDMGNSTHIGVPPGPYAFSMANYAPSNSAAVTSTSNEDIAASQVKENNIYVSGQQIEGSGVWFTTTPNRDISTLPPTSFYNLPQGQLGFNPTQPGHGTFTGVFHHPAQGAAAPVHPFFQQSQAITSPADMAGPTAGVYQQQQHAQQMNWPSNY